MDFVDPRLLQAIWRWRTRRLLRTATLRQRQAARLLPAFLHATFQHPDLQQEPPGIEGTLAPRGWAMLARAFHLPPPLSASRGRRLVRGVVMVPVSGGSLDLVVVSTGLLGELEEERLNQRLIAAEKLLRKGGADVRVRLFSPTNDSLRVLAFGGRIAGNISEEELAPTALSVPDAAGSQTLVADAPSPLAALSLLLLVGRWTQSIPAWFQALHDEGQTAALLSDPEFFTGLVAAKDGEAGDASLQAVAHAAGDPLVREAIRGLVPKAPPPQASSHRGRRPQSLSPHAALLELGRNLALAAARTVRRAPVAGGALARARLRSEVLAPGIPMALVPALQLAGSNGAAGRLEPPRPGQEQAFARRLAIAVRTGLRGAADDMEPIWRRVSALMSSTIAEPTLLISAELLDMPGPPMDPLNRGHGRVVALAPPLVVSLRPDGRPTARRLSAEEAVLRLVMEANRGTVVEVVGTSGAAQPAVSRLVRLAQLCRMGASGDIPLAVELGGRVLLLEADGMSRSFDVKRFAARPRIYVPDPESPDLAPQASARGGAVQRRLGVSVDCLVSPVDASNAAIIYTDTEGFHLREEVALPFLEDHLQEAQVILRGSPSPALLAVRVAGHLDLTAARQAAPVRRMEIEVEGDLIYGLRLRLMGETFGSGERWGWRAAAVAVLSVWSSPAAGRLAVRIGNLEVAGEPADALSRLYTRSVVQRRLTSHLFRMGALKSSQG